MRLHFAVTLFVSAALLFLVQPMVAKMILPLLGGSPSVWNTCMVFFQAMLLAGYAYAHAAPAWLGVKRHAIIHLFVLALPLALLPIRVASSGPPADASPAPWLLLLLLTTVGLPFFALATNAPLLQRWFAHTGHPSGRDPYFLYGASNLGSMLALLGYPLVFEPHLRLATQSRLWMVGYAVLLPLTVTCVIVLWRSPGARGDAESSPHASEPTRPSPPVGPAAALSWPRRLRWTALAFVPSSLMLGVTGYITTDIVAFPLLWVIPLALYLLSFIVVFSRPPAALHRTMVVLLPISILLLIVARMNLTHLEIGAVVLLHLAVFLVATLVCHGELALDRPPARDLTGFYLWMSVGGVLGGVMNALIAPQIFDRVVEYPLAIVLACLLKPGLALVPAAPTPSAAEDARRSGDRRADARPERHGQAGGRAARERQVASPALRSRAASRGWRTSWSWSWAAFALVVGVVLFAQSFGGDLRYQLHSERNFFGVRRVRFDPERRLIAMLHGTTVHGMQSLDSSRRGEPLSYFHRTGPIGQVFAALDSPDLRRIGIVGLGIGTLASYARSGEEWTYYEIDPAVERLARNTDYFTYVADCEARGVPLSVVLGDARLQLARSSARYNLLVLDAFSSDVVPVHLLTREALRLYLARLEARGVLAVHISSQYFRLEPVIAGLARDAGLTCRFEVDVVNDPAVLASGKVSSRWAVLARRPEDLGTLAGDPRWRPFDGRDAGRVWTDDYSNILSVILWQREGASGTRQTVPGGFVR